MIREKESTVRLYIMEGQGRRNLSIIKPVQPILNQPDTVDKLAGVFAALDGGVEFIYVILPVVEDTLDEALVVLRSHGFLTHLLQRNFSAIIVSHQLHEQSQNTRGKMSGQEENECVHVSAFQRGCMG